MDDKEGKPGIEYISCKEENRLQRGSRGLHLLEWRIRATVGDMNRKTQGVDGIPVEYLKKLEEKATKELARLFGDDSYKSLRCGWG